MMSFIGNFFGRQTGITFSGATDWHSHILPGVDDGVKTPGDALKILSRYEEMGIAEVWLTPHVMEELPNTPEKLQNIFLELKQSYTGPIKLRLAAENMLDGLFAERLASGRVLPIGPKRNMLLVETSYFNPPAGLSATFESIKKAGFVPLMAHPERYAYVDGMEEYGRWRALGVRFQLNLMSLGGHYGAAAKNRAEQLLKNEMYDFVGTDIHHPAHLDTLMNLRISSRYADELANLLMQ